MPHVRKASDDGNGYLQITLCKNSKQKSFKVHRLVAEAFIPNPDGLPEVNHIDENKYNCAASNLEWCDRLYNVNYGDRSMKTMKAVIQMNDDGMVLNEFQSIKEAAKCIGAKTFGGISAACKGKTLHAYGYRWKWKEGA